MSVSSLRPALILVASSLLLAGVPAHAYGPYTHAYIASETAKRLGYEAGPRRYYVAGALLADIDKAGRLRTLVGDSIAKLVQGCNESGPLGRALTHEIGGALATKLLASPDANARAFGAGIRNHAIADRYADDTMPSALGHANTGNEDLAFDVGPARTGIAGAKAALDDAVDAGVLESAELASWLSSASGLPLPAVTTQMRGYSCFVRGFVRGKAAVVAPMLHTALLFSWTKACIAAAKGIKARLRCLPGVMTKAWDHFVNENKRVVDEVILRNVADQQPRR